MSDLRLTVKNYKRAEWASEETDCFTASLYLDGKKIGWARNDGRGGCDFYDFVSRDAREAFEAYVEEWKKTVSDDPNFCLEDGRCFAGAESLVGEACANFRREREMKKALKGYAAVVRIERPEGWVTNIFTARLPEGVDVDEVISTESQDGDSVFVYDGSAVIARNA
jgi:hypothetical protein